MKDLQDVLRLSDNEFKEFQQKDDFEGFPAHLPRETISLVKLWEFLEERGGELSLTITLNDVTRTIPA